jgi:hypothetical protein
MGAKPVAEPYDSAAERTDSMRAALPNLVIVIIIHAEMKQASVGRCPCFFFSHPAGFVFVLKCRIMIICAQGLPGWK